MKQAHTVVLCLLLVIASAFTPGKDVKFKSKTGRFSIHFKQAPQETSEDIETDVGPIKLNMFMYEESTAKAYMVSYSDYPAGSVTETNAREMLRYSKQQFLETLEIVTTSENEQSFMKYPSIYFTASSSKYNAAYRMVLAGDRLYQIGILNEKTIEQADIDGFINTFKILK